ARRADRGLRLVGRGLGAELVGVRPTASRAAAALREARCRTRRRRGARAHAGSRGHDGVTDSHAHLDAFEEPPFAIVERGRAAGVSRIVTIGTGIESSHRALSIADELDGVYAAVGIDPHQAGTTGARRVHDLRALLEHRKAVAVGETGLDFVRTHATPLEQRRLLDAQLELAAEL